MPNPAPYLIEISFEQHADLLRMHELANDSKTTADYDAQRNRTSWRVGRNTVAISQGPAGTRRRCWAVVQLTSAQRAFAADQASNNEGADDEEFVALLCQEGGLILPDAKVLLVERNRCMQAPMYEPLQERLLV